MNAMLSVLNIRKILHPFTSYFSPLSTKHSSTSSHQHIRPSIFSLPTPSKSSIAIQSPLISTYDQGLWLSSSTLLYTSKLPPLFSIFHLLFAHLFLFTYYILCPHHPRPSSPILPSFIFIIPNITDYFLCFRPKFSSIPLLPTQLYPSHQKARLFS